MPVLNILKEQPMDKLAVARLIFLLNNTRLFYLLYLHKINGIMFGIQEIEVESLGITQNQLEL